MEVALAVNLEEDWVEAQVLAVGLALEGVSCLAASVAEVYRAAALTAAWGEVWEEA